jgi:hypothetical protein
VSKTVGYDANVPSFNGPRNIAPTWCVADLTPSFTLSTLFARKRTTRMPANPKSMASGDLTITLNRVGSFRAGRHGDRYAQTSHVLDCSGCNGRSFGKFIRRIYGAAAGSGTVKAVTWYDQCGAHDQTQATTANAPIIYQSGAVNFINSTRPALLLVSASPTWLTNATLAQNPVNTLFINAVIAPDNGNDRAIVGGSASNNLEWRTNFSSLTMTTLASVTASLGTSSSGVTATGSVAEMQYESVGGVGSFWIDGAAAGTYTTAHTFSGGGAIQIGTDGAATEPSQGSIGEIVMYDLVGGIPSGSRTSIEANQKAYWGTP